MFWQTGEKCQLKSLIRLSFRWCWWKPTVASILGRWEGGRPVVGTGRLPPSPRLPPPGQQMVATLLCPPEPTSILCPHLTQLPPHLSQPTFSTFRPPPEIRRPLSTPDSPRHDISSKLIWDFVFGLVNIFKLGRSPKKHVFWEIFPRYGHCHHLADRILSFSSLQRRRRRRRRAGVRLRVSICHEKCLLHLNQGSPPR